MPMLSRYSTRVEIFISFLDSSLDIPDCVKASISSCLTPICFLKSESLIRNISFSASFLARCTLAGGSIVSSSSIKSFLLTLSFISVSSIYLTLHQTGNRQWVSSFDKTACLHVCFRRQEGLPFYQDQRQIRF